MNKVKHYFSLVTFSHTIFAMPFALLGLALGFHTQQLDYSTYDYLGKLALVILCMIFARSAAMAFNRYLDVDIDKLNNRTRDRDIPAGRITRTSALYFVIVMSLLFILTTLFINPLCFYLSPLALAVILFYSYAKRFTGLCHLILGLGLALAPIGAYMAVTSSLPFGILYLGLAVLFWVSGFDVIYSLQDEEFDRSQNLHSIPVYLGIKHSITFSRVLHSLSILFLLAALLYFYDWKDWPFMIAFAVFVGFLIYQQQLVNRHDLSLINKKYMASNGMASLVFCLICIVAILFY